MDPLIVDVIMVLGTVVGGLGVTILALVISGAFGKPGKRVAGRGRRRRR